MSSKSLAEYISITLLPNQEVWEFLNAFVTMEISDVYAPTTEMLTSPKITIPMIRSTRALPFLFVENFIPS